MNDKIKPYFSDEKLISVYTRARAIDDGILVDVSTMAKEAGFRYPVAVTAALWADIATIPSAYEGIQDINGRLWDVLWMARQSIRSGNEDASTLFYNLIMHVGQTKYYTVKLVCGPGDHGEPVLALMRPNEA